MWMEWSLPATTKMYEFVLFAIILWIVFKILNVNNSPEASTIYCSNQKFQEEILSLAPELSQAFVPTRLWGFSGHIQTLIKPFVSRMHCPLVNGQRISMKLTDGATLTYELYPTINLKKCTRDITLAICPGIGNNSESVYIKRMVYHAQLNGYRVCVLNHIGTLSSVPVTSPRIFMYGNTGDFAAMIKDLVKRFPESKVVCVGFSMGGNMIAKYLGEPRVKPENIIAGIAVCSGYDCSRGLNMLMEWSGLRRMYMYVMAEDLKAIIRRFSKELFPDHIKTKLGITERQVLNSSSLCELDDVYTRRLAGFKSLTEYYGTNSACHYFKNIKVPTVFINTLDDPIIPPPLLETVRDAALKYENIVFVEQKFGGHLGFYEGGFLYCNPLTWQHRMVVHIADALSHITGKRKEGVKALGLEEEEFEEDINIQEEKIVVHNSKKGISLKNGNFNTEITSDYTSLDSSDSDTPA